MYKSERVNIIQVDEIDNFDFDKLESKFDYNFKLIKSYDNGSVIYKEYEHKINKTKIYQYSTKPIEIIKHTSRD